MMMSDNTDNAREAPQAPRSNNQRELALVTGASGGIGGELALELAGRGYDVIITARRADRLMALKAKIEAAHRVRVHVLPEDLGVPGGAESLIRQVDVLGQPVSFLANNAGFGLHGDFLDHEPGRLEQMLRLNMLVLTTLTLHFGRTMRARGRGCVLQVSSVGGFQSSPYYAAYSATKAYVLLLSEAMHFELRKSGVTVTTLCPGLTDTEFHEVAEHPKTGIAALTTMSASTVAQAGVRAALRGRRLLIPGLMNKLTMFMLRFLPRSWTIAGTGLMMK